MIIIIVSVLNGYTHDFSLRGLMEVVLCESEEYLDQLAVNFTASLSHFGSMETVELETGGNLKKVTLWNRNHFVKKLYAWHLIGI